MHRPQHVCRQASRGTPKQPHLPAPAPSPAGRLRGPGSSYLAHIQSATGVVASLAGQRSGSTPEGTEPLHMRLACQDAAKLEEGRK